MDTPEWSIFDRLDEIEDITLKLMEKADITEPTLKDTTTIAREARILAWYGIGMGFLETAQDLPNPRALKDNIIRSLNNLGLSQRTLKTMEEMLIKMCEVIEEAKTGK